MAEEVHVTDTHPLIWFAGGHDTTRAGMIIEPLLGEDVLVASDLDWVHRDPFDRMIVAVVRRLDLKLITIDESITDSELVEVAW